MNISYHCLFMAGILWLSGCSSVDTPELIIDEDKSPAEEISLSRFEPIQFTESELKCGKAVCAFGIDMLHEGIMNMPADGIMIQSPLSATLALTMLANGAEGETLAEIRKSLYDDCSLDEINSMVSKLCKNLGSTDTSVSTTLVNSLWANTPFSFAAQYKDEMNNLFGTETFEKDFSLKSTRDAMDKWCADNTQNLINKISDCIDTTMKALIMNATYFKGPWSNRFYKENNEKGTFRGTDHVAEVDMMNKREQLRFAQNGDYSMVELPFGNGGYAMTVLLPEINGPLSESCESLSPTVWNSLQNSAKITDVILSIPKFKIETTVSLVRSLINMGISHLFGPEAELGKMSDNDGLWINNMIQRSALSIDEKGAECAVVTAAGLVFDNVSLPQAIVRIDRPFIILITEKNAGLILFAAAIEQL